MAAFTQISATVPNALAEYVRAEGRRHPRGVSGVVADALTHRQATGAALVTGAMSPDAAGLTDLIRRAMEAGTEREARIDVRIAQLADIMAELAAQSAADGHG